jgi:hypothetical protein
MSEITIGKVKIFLDGRSLTFLHEDRPNSPIVLPASAIDDLIGFLRSLNPETTERRMAFRVAVPRLTDLTVRIGFKGKTWSVAPVDLSLTGILIEFPKPEAVDIPADAKISLELRLGDKNSVLMGVVRRRKDNQYGILFVDSLRNGELKPPESLVYIYKELERQWLRRRLK